MKVKLFTHNDLDGISCVILSKFIFTDIDVEICDYNNINEKVIDFYTNNIPHAYDYIFITDISVNKETAPLIDLISPSNTVLLDHHKTAEWLNIYSWATVNETINDIKTSGTELFFNYINKNKWFKINLNKNIEYFVEKIRRYDTWDWEKLNDLDAKKLNDLMGIIGTNNFINKYIIYLNGNFSNLFDDYDLLSLQLQQDRIDKYIKNKQKKIITKKIEDYNAGVIFAEQFVSELGNKLAQMNPQYDFIAIINMFSGEINYRGIKDDIDLGKIAKVFNGGGHPKAAGSPINQHEILTFIDKIFE